MHNAKKITHNKDLKERQIHIHYLFVHIAYSIGHTKNQYVFVSFLNKYCGISYLHYIGTVFGWPKMGISLT